MWKEFKEFAFKGNVIDMAVGVIIGTAFGKIVTSLVNDIVMPLIGKLTSGVDFKDLKILLTDDPEGAALMYGNFIQNIVDFFIIAICVFLFVKILTSTKKRFEKPVEEVAEPEVKKPTEAELLEEIRDLLKNK